MRGSSNDSAARVVRLICTQNPFYVISAALVLYGLRQCTIDAAGASGGWLLMGVLCGYTLLLAGAAGLIVRAIGCITLPIAAGFAAATYDSLFPKIPAPIHMLYILALAMVAWGFWERRQQAHNLAGAFATSLASVLLPAKRAYVMLHATALERALPYLAVGLLLLLLAVLISLDKGGLLRRGWFALQRLNDQLRRQPTG